VITPELVRISAIGSATEKQAVLSLNAVLLLIIGTLEYQK